MSTLIQTVVDQKRVWISDNAVRRKADGGEQSSLFADPFSFVNVFVMKKSVVAVISVC